MIAALCFARAVVTALIFFFVGLAFLPHSAASILARAQKFLTDEIDRRDHGGRQ